MLQDGVPYPAIILNLGDNGKHLNIANLSRWKNGGYKEWLLEQAFIERTRARQETPGQLVCNFDATEVNHAALQLGTLHIFEALRDLGPGSLNKKLGGDCAAFARLINALARASRETMQLQKYREACARARAALQELKDPHRKLTDSETRAIVRKVDEILGISSDDLEIYSRDGKVQSPQSTVHSPQSEVRSPESEVQGPEFEVQGPKSKVQSQESDVLGPESTVESLQPTESTVENPSSPTHPLIDSLTHSLTNSPYAPLP
jgi:hypothetical protein